MSTPHRYELGRLEPGTHECTLRIDNTVKIGVGDANAQGGTYNLAHSITEHTQTNWNGVVGRLELQATDPVWVDDVQVYPNLAHKSARLVVTLGNVSGASAKGHLTFEASSTNADAAHSSPPVTVPFEAGETRHSVELEYPLGDDVLPWSEFSPALYTLRVTLRARGEDTHFHDEHGVSFGMRDFAERGTQFTLNDQPVFLRGTLECCIFPRTGYPPTEGEAWQRIMSVAKAHGLNHLRFHSWCPPEAAFAAADAAGMFLQVEGPFWAEFGSDSQVDAFAYTEGDHILKTYGNHPSFCLMAVSNEPSGERKEVFFAEILKHWREQDPRRLYTAGAGWPIIPENDYHCTPLPRSYQWGEGLEGRFNAVPFSTEVDYQDFVDQYDVPVVSHEIGQWTAFPDFKQLDKYTGVLKPYNLEHSRTSLTANGLAEQAEAFLMASGKLQTLLYKEEIEAALRTPGFGGFQLLDLHDFPGQGTALVGVLDAFWDGKGYVTPGEFRAFCSETVPLMRTNKVVWQNHETLEAAFEIAHFGPEVMEDAVLEWSLEDTEDRILAADKLTGLLILYGSGIPLGSIRFSLADFAAPGKLTLRAKVKGTLYHNAWSLWLYPRHLAMPDGVHRSDRLDETSLSVLQQGGSVLLTPRPETVTNDIPLGFTTPFWNTRWTDGQPPHTMGILCDPAHPALRDFPTEFHSDWQWWEILHGAKCLVLDDLSHVAPIIQVIDDWVTNRKLALAFEVKMGKGRLLICSADLSTNLNERPVARQLLYSFLTYLGGETFEPAAELEPSSLKTLGTFVTVSP